MGLFEIVEENEGRAHQEQMGQLSRGPRGYTIRWPEETAKGRRWRSKRIYGTYLEARMELDRLLEMSGLEAADRGDESEPEPPRTRD